MPYMLALVVVAIAVVLGIFTGVWGGIVWLGIAAVVLAVVFGVRARNTEVPTANVTPSGSPRGGPSSSGTANQRVGQG